MTTEWHPWFSYEWWHDIVVPALGAVGGLGGIAVGVGAVLAALSSNRIASAVADRESGAQFRQEEAKGREERAAFAIEVRHWIDQAMYELTTLPAKRLRPNQGRYAGDRRTELDMRAAALSSRSAVELLRVIATAMVGVPVITSERDRELASARRSVALAHLRAWVSNPDTWLELDDDAELTAEEWVTAAQVRGRYESHPVRRNDGDRQRKRGDGR